VDSIKPSSKCLLESIRMGLEEGGVVGTRSHFVEEAVRSFEVCEELARKSEMEEPRVLRVGLGWVLLWWWSSIPSMVSGSLVA
jgi:hypothetical protein